MILLTRSFRPHCRYAKVINPNIKFKKWLFNYTGGHAITVTLQQFKENCYPHKDILILIIVISIFFPRENDFEVSKLAT